MVERNTEFLFSSYLFYVFIYFHEIEWPIRDAESGRGKTGNKLVKERQIGINRQTHILIQDEWTDRRLVKISLVFYFCSIAIRMYQN